MDVCEVDVGLILGFGFVFYIGGILSYIDMMGIVVFVDLCRKFIKKWGFCFKLNKFLCDMVKDNEMFYGKFLLKVQFSV